MKISGFTRSKLKILMAFCLSAMLLLVAACGSGNNGQASSQGSDQPASKGSNQPNDSGYQGESVELNFWSWVPLPEEWEKDIYPKFQEKYPNIKINYTRDVKPDYEQKLRVAVQSGEMPDLVGLQLGAFVHQYESVLEPLGPYAEKALGQDWRSLFREAPMNRAAEYDFKALPTGIVTTPYIAYDVDMFAKAGIEKPPATYEELKEAVKKLEAAKLSGVIPRLGIAGGEWLSGLRDFFLNIVNQVAPGKIYEATAGKISFTDPDIVKAAAELKKWYDDGVFQEGNLGTKYNPQMNDMFMSKGQLPMMVMGSWVLRDFANKEQMGTVGRHFGLAPFPVIEGGRRVVLTDGDMALGISKDSKHKEAAWKFVEFMLTDHWQKMLGDQFTFLPVNKQFEVNADTFVNPEELAAAKMLPEYVAENGGFARFLDYPEIDNALFENLQKVAAGKSTPQEAMESVQKVSEKVKR